MLWKATLRQYVEIADSDFASTRPNQFRFLQADSPGNSDFFAFIVSFSVETISLPLFTQFSPLLLPGCYH